MNKNAYFFEMAPEEFCGKISFVLTDLIEHTLSLHPENYEGVFRLNGSDKHIKLLISDLNHGRVTNFDKYGDIHTFTTCIKRFFGKMAQSNPIIPFEYYPALVKVMASRDEATELEFLIHLVEMLNPERKRTLAYLMHFLNFVSLHQAKTKMTPKNIGICIGPNIATPPQVTAQSISESSYINDATALMIQYYDKIFAGITIDKSVFCTDEDIAILLRPPPNLAHIQQQIFRCQYRENKLIPFRPLCRLLSTEQFQRPQNPPPPKPTNPEENNNAQLCNLFSKFTVLGNTNVNFRSSMRLLSESVSSVIPPEKPE